MKTNFIIVSIVFLNTLFSQSKVNLNNMVEYGGKSYKQNEDEPYTGKVFDLYKSNGKNKLEGYYKNGFRNDNWSWYGEDGEMDSSGNYRNGKKYGQWMEWDGNGNKKREEYFSKGRLVKKTEWIYEPYRSVKSFKYGERNGTWTHWYENGKKWNEGTYRQGKKVGQWTHWYENGQKKYEGRYRNKKKNLLNMFSSPIFR